MLLEEFGGKKQLIQKKALVIFQLQCGFGDVILLFFVDFDYVYLEILLIFCQKRYSLIISWVDFYFFINYYYYELVRKFYYIGKIEQLIYYLILRVYGLK